MPYSKIMDAHGNKATFVQGTLKNVNANNTIDIVNGDAGHTQTITFDFLVICTGG
jgi:hypothetical protein